MLRWAGALCLAVVLGPAPSVMAGEILGRSLFCLPKGPTNYCTWRLLPNDPGDVGFNLYRATDPAGLFTRVNDTPFTVATNAEDGSGIVAGSTYYYRVRTVDAAGAEGAASEPARVTAGPAQNHLRLDIQVPMSIARVVPGDLNGDGIFDFVVLTPHNDNNTCPMPGSDTFFVEALLSEGGTWVSGWRVDTQTGRGATNMCNDKRMVVLLWDLDGDAKAEVVLRAGAAANEMWILDGATGALKATGVWPDWPDTLGVADRHYATIALMRDVDDDGISDPFIVVQRGLYGAGQLFKAFRFDPASQQIVETDTLAYGNDSRGRGSHGLPAVDIDNDGRDEILACQTVIDDDFTELWSVGENHNDTCYAADIRPDIPGLEIFMGEEGDMSRRTYLVATRPDGTAQILWTRRGRLETQCVPQLPADFVCAFSWERGWCAELDLSRPGLECYEHEHWEDQSSDLKKGYGHLFSADGVHDDPMPTGKWPMDWVEGEGVKELYNFCNAPGVTGCGYYFGWPADILGDSREESVVFRDTFVKIYTNTELTNSRFVTAVADRGYRGAVARIGVGYNPNWIPTKTNQARDDLVYPCQDVTCGSACCDPGQVCFEEACCLPGCAGRECGDDGCGGHCGECGLEEVCDAQGSCVPQTCDPDCSGRECGLDPLCGLSCGECGQDEACSAEGSCVPEACEPDCGGRECGGDGCGGTCGTCVSGSTCSAEGRCESEPDPPKDTPAGCACGVGDVRAFWVVPLVFLFWLFSRRGRGARRGSRE